MGLGHREFGMRGIIDANQAQFLLVVIGHPPRLIFASLVHKPFL